MSAVTSVSAREFDWEQWLNPDDELEKELTEEEQLEAMKLISRNDSFELFLNQENGVFCVRNIKTKGLWWSNPIDRNKDEIAGGQVKKILSSQLSLSCYSSSDVQMKHLNSYADCVQAGGYSYESIEKGYAATYCFPNHNISIKMEVRLTSKGFEVTVPLSSLQDSEDMLVCNLDILPYMLCGGTDDEGYLFVPDGTGAIINFNNGKSSGSIYQEKVYGNNLTYAEEWRKARILLPVFGIKKNNSGIFAVIVQGAESAEICAAVFGQKSSYNNVYSSFTFRSSHTYATGAYNQTSFDVYERKSPSRQSAYSIDYTFLDEGKNEYSDMAQIYRQRLIDQYMAASDIQYSVVLDVLGAVRKVKPFLGIPVMQSEAISKVKSLEALLNTFSEKGISGIALRYSSATKSVLEGKLSKRLEIASSLGSMKDFIEVARLYAEKGNKVFIEYDPVMYVKKLFFPSTKLATKDMLGQIVKLQKNNAIGKKDDSYTPRILLKPTKLVWYTQQLLKSIKSDEFGYSPRVITQNVYIDYDELSKGAEQTVECFTESLKLLCDSGGVMSSRSSNYALPFSELVVDLPYNSSRFDLLDSSVPFYEIAVSGVVPYSYTSINMSADCRLSFLKCIETGAVPKYSLVVGDMSLLAESLGTDWYAGDSKVWVPYIIEQLKEYKDYRGKIENGHIVAHSLVTPYLSKTVFENGVTVLVNFGADPVQYKNIAIDAESYVLLDKDEVL